MAKLSRKKTFTVFQPIAKVFPLNHLPCTVHNGMGLMHHKNFPVNSVFCAQPQKFSPLKVLPYTVTHTIGRFKGGSVPQMLLLPTLVLADYSGTWEITDEVLRSKTLN